MTERLKNLLWVGVLGFSFAACAAVAPPLPAAPNDPANPAAAMQPTRAASQYHQIAPLDSKAP